MYQHVCPQCGEPFLDKRPHAKFCSFKCRGLAKRKLPDYACERCGKPFRSKDDNPRFCSRECYDADRSDQSSTNRNRTCLYCGKSFYRVSLVSVYCSRVCANKSKAITLQDQCVVCGTPFKRYQHRLEQQYCSQKCYDIARRPAERTCPQCGGLFVPKSPDQKNCSRTCRSAARVSVLPRPCLQCGKVFKDSHDETQFCSVRCYGIWQRGLARRSGKNFTNAQRRIIKTRDEYRCVKCGSTDKLHVDHILPIAEGGEPTLANGQTLCAKCHSRKTVSDLRRLHKRKRGEQVLTIVQLRLPFKS